MAITVFLSLSVICLIFFVVSSHKMHLFEILIVWMTIVFTHENILAAASLNIKVFDISEEIDKVLSLFFSRVILTPVIIISLFDALSKMRKLRLKLLLTIITACILVGNDYLAEWLGIIRYTNDGKWMWSFLQWLFIMMIAFLINKWFQAVFKKEVQI